MRKFQHGDHEAALMTMRLEEARESGIIPYTAFPNTEYETRLCYAFCSVCKMSTFVVDFMNDKKESSLEERVVSSFMALEASCKSVRAYNLVSGVMNA